MSSKHYKRTECDGCGAVVESGLVMPHWAQVLIQNEDGSAATPDFCPTCWELMQSIVKPVEAGEEEK